MKKRKKCISKNNFTKLTHGGISLIVLVITIIVIIILATAIIVSVLSNNPVMEANKARYENDADNMQAVFTNTVAKIMAKTQGTVSVTAGAINTVTSGVKETTGEVLYTVNNPVNKNYINGKIVFDNGDDTIVQAGNSFESNLRLVFTEAPEPEPTYVSYFYTGKKLPIYAAGDTTWYVDDEGNIALEVAGNSYGNGVFAKLTKDSLIKKYEDLAGDEEGVTEGKIHIGDYVDYNPIADGITEKTEENGYKYVANNDISGIEDAIADGYETSILNGVTQQNFTTKDNLKWRVIGAEGASLLITPEESIVPDNPITINGTSGAFMYGAKGYVNTIDIINAASKIYSNGELAESATGMTIDHINKLTGVTVTENEILPDVTLNVLWRLTIYGREYNIAAGNSLGWTPEAWINKSKARAGVILSPGVSGKVTGYVYDLDNAELKTANTSSVKYSLIDYTGNEVYCLASRGIAKASNGLWFGPGAVMSGQVYSFSNFFTSGAVSTGRAGGFRPVVKLKPNITGEIISTDASGVSTWHITLEE